jgi:ABC-2 type transport system ATP-binding protein
MSSGEPASPPVAPAAGDWWGVQDACVWYGHKLALDHVSLRVCTGELCAVVGGDGAGRTTLLRCLAGAQAPGSGEVKRPPPLRIGYTSAGSGVYPDLSVAENLAFRAAAYQLPAAAARERGADLLDRAGLTPATDRLAGRLSGGMRQKLGVIASMLHRPDLLVLDEPTTGVDPVSRAGLWWLIARAAADGAAVVLATSYLDEAERALAVLVLDQGRELASGSPRDIVQAMPGTLRASDERPPGEAGRWAWRRGGRWRVWDPDPRGGDRAQDPHGGTVTPDLQDAVTVAALIREAAGGAPASGPPASGALATRRSP